MVANLKVCYSEESSSGCFSNKAAFLDPRFSCLVHLSSEERNLVSNSLSQEIKENERDNDCTSRRRDGCPECDGKPVWGLVSSDFCKRNRDAIQEMQSCMKETPLTADSNPLLWWRDTGCNRSPQLSNLARKYLSVCSEQLFLSAGNIVNKKRTALNPDHIERLVFLANNIRN